MSVPLPSSVCEIISIRAAEIARQTAPRSKFPGTKGHGADHIMPKSNSGSIGLEVPEEFFYMMIQDRGMRPFIMKNLEGRTIPIRDASGAIHFRTARNVGKRVVTSRDEQGRIIASKISWRHPGLRGKQFMDKALRQALNEMISSMDTKSAISMLEQSDLGVAIKQLQGKV